MTVTEQVRSDITGAMKAGEKGRVGALRLVLSELQKAEKEGGDDELTVLRRERKRRLDAAAQFRDGGRPELADQEESEADLISTYLPALPGLLSYIDLRRRMKTWEAAPEPSIVTAGS